MKRPPRVDINQEPRHLGAGGGRVLRLSALIAVLGLAASLGLGAAAGSARFYQAYLVNFAFFLSLSLGALFFVLIQHVTGATWSVVVRRLAETLAANLPWLGLLAIPVLLGMRQLYPWSDPVHAAHDPLLAAKAPYLNPGFFIVRLAIYFLVWTWLSLYYYRRSCAQDATGDLAHTHGMQRLSGPGLVLFALTVSFASFDLLMSLNPHWFSTIFGVVIFAGSMMSCYATLALTGLWLTKNGELTHTITTANLHDAGKMMFGFTVFWAYVSFSQYYLIWYGNIPEETAWYYRRLQDGWQSIGLLLILGHFIVPFWVLMSRHVKRNRTMLGIGAGWMLLMHFVDLYFMVMPTLHHGLHPHWADLTAVLGIGGLYIAFFARRLASAPVVAHRDPQLVASMEYDNV